jgi:hypothetical protein
VEENVPRAVEDAMWDLYQAYADEIQMEEEFLPLQEVYEQNPIQHPSPPPMVNPGQIGATNINVSSTSSARQVSRAFFGEWTGASRK